MLQVLFTIPLTPYLFPPDGIPLNGFGAMLFLAFALVTGWGGARAARIGLPREKLQDLAILLFLSGIAGARLLYMLQYPQQFPNRSPLGLFKAFFQIWNGGIVFYGSIFTGVVAYLLFRRRVLKPLGVSGWRLADAVAPLMAAGMAVGRMGCYLNGCCWGQVACEECQPVPISAELGRFPLLPSHARKQLTLTPDDYMRAADTARVEMPHIHGLQTTTGFSIRPPEPPFADPRSVVAAVEPGSEAESAGLMPGDRIVGVNGKPVRILLSVTGTPAGVKAATDAVEAAGGTGMLEFELPGRHVALLGFDTLQSANAVRAKLAPLAADGLTLTPTNRDDLDDLVRKWPRGEDRITLALERDGKSVELTFTPRTVSFFPTQVYETVSMILLTMLLLAFQPFRRHDGQMLVVLILGYASHRFLNEALRIEPSYSGLTLSQWISVGIFAAGVAMELYLRRTQPRLPAGLKPLAK